MNEERKQNLPFRIVVTEYHPKPNPRQGVPIWTVKQVTLWLKKISNDSGLEDFAPIFEEREIDGGKLMFELKQKDIPEFNAFHRWHFWDAVAKLRMKYLTGRETEPKGQNVLELMSSLGEWRHHEGDCSVSDEQFNHKHPPYNMENLSPDILKGEAFQTSCIAFSDKGQLKTQIPEDPSGLWVFHESKQDESKRGILLFAAAAGYTEIVELLLNFRITHEVSKSGETSLLLASRRGHKDVVKAFLDYLHEHSEHQEFYRQKSARGYTPLMAAANRGHTDIVKLLLQTEHAHDINFRTQVGWTPLTAAAHNGHFNVVEELLNSGEEIDFSNDKYDYGNTLLMLACRHGHVDVVDALLNQKDVNIDQQNQGGGTALLIAAYSGNTEIVKRLLQHDPAADIEMRDNEGKTALMWAASGGYADVITVLLQNNPPANIGLKSEGGFSALQLCATRGYLDAVKALRNHGKYQSELESTEDLKAAIHRVRKSIHVKVHDYFTDLENPEKRKQEPSRSSKRQKLGHGAGGEHPEATEMDGVGGNRTVKRRKSSDENQCACCTIS